MTDEELAKALAARNVCFFHAMNLRGFARYCETNSLLSRTALAEADPNHTRFWSDEGDAGRDVLSRVFGNVYDFAAIFARARVDSSPNIYGPVTLAFSHGVFREMNDIVVTQQTVADLPNPWRSHALNDAQIAEMLAGDNYGSPVAAPFHYAELSCANRALSLTQLEEVIVEPLTVGDCALAQWVEAKLRRHGIAVPVRVRRYGNPAHLALLQELANGLDELHHEDARPDRITFDEVPPEVAAMHERFHPRFEIWATYFYNGTVTFLREQRREGAQGGCPPA